MVAARSSGYIQGYVDPALLSVAVEHDVVINLIHPIGHHIVESRPVAYAWNPDPGALPVGVEHLADDIRAAILMAPERYEDRDVGFGIRQLVDIAVRSVSPSVNDPYTSVMTIQPLSALMVATERSYGSRYTTVMHMFDRSTVRPRAGTNGRCPLPV